MTLNPQGTGKIKKKSNHLSYLAIPNSKETKNTQLEQEKKKKSGEIVLRTSETTSSILTFVSWGFQKEKSKQGIKNLFKKL